MGGATEDHSFEESEVRSFHLQSIVNQQVLLHFLDEKHAGEGGGEGKGTGMGDYLITVNGEEYDGEDRVKDGARESRNGNSNRGRCSSLPNRSTNWTKVRNVFRGINLFKSCEVEKITKISDIEAHIGSLRSQGNSPLPEMKRPTKLDNSSTPSMLLRFLQEEAKENAIRDQFRLIDELKDRKYFFEALANGAPEDIRFIEQHIKDDPKRYLLVEESPERRMNKTDSQGQTPLYVAAKNGNIEVIDILVKYKANHNLSSNPTKVKNYQETPLGVAARWGQLSTVEHLLKVFNWTPKQLKNARADAGSSTIAKIISTKLA